MSKLAISIEEQIHLIESRGMTVSDRDKAREILEDVGYFRLGFYLFPLEKTYPSLHHRTHQYLDGAKFEDVVNLYYFDYDLRILLMRYLNRIEIAFRAAINNNLSQKYNHNPVWFSSTDCVRQEYADNFDKMVYTAEFKRIPVIHRHHNKYTKDKYAPAWKTLEFMTFGSVIKLYEQLRISEDKIKLANKFGVRQVVTFENYIHTIRQLRNACAHGFTLFDMCLPRRIRRGPADIELGDNGNIIGAIKVTNFILGQVSRNRAEELTRAIHTLYQSLISRSPMLEGRIFNFSKI